VRYGLAEVKQAEAAYAAQVRERLEKQLRRRAQELGSELVKVAAPVEPAAEQGGAVGVQSGGSGGGTDGNSQGVGGRSAGTVRAAHLREALGHCRVTPEGSSWGGRPRRRSQRPLRPGATPRG
jgi:hypothetical protein